MMIHQVIAFSVRNKLIIVLFTCLIAGWGLYSLTEIPIDAVPDITNNQVQVITTSRNLAAQEVEQLITYPVELAMANLPGVSEIRSISRFGLSVVTVVFEERMGTYLPRQLVGEKLSEAQENIGQGLGNPQLGPISTGLGEIFQYSVEAAPGYEEEYDATELRTIQDWIIKRQLTMIPGVVEISSWGGYQKQYEVAVDPGRLNAYGLTIQEIFTALEANNENTGGSYLEKGPNLYYIRGQGLAQTFEDIAQIVVTRRNGIPVTIGQVADVGKGTAPRYGAATVNGQGETVIGVVMMLKGANSAVVVEQVKDRMDQIRETLPEGILIRPFIDRTKLVRKTTATITENLVLGGLIVMGALVVLLGTFRSGLIVASVIPLSFLFAIGMMNTFGVSANLMSLGAIDFGIIVDGAVIIVELMVVLLVSRFRELEALAGTERQSLADQLAVQASSRMMNAAVFGQLIILIVFIPILTLQGVEGKMFQPMALTFGFAILGAMLLCLTYVPMVIATFLYSKGLTKRTLGDRLMERLMAGYARVLRWTLAHGRLVVVTGVSTLAVAGLLFSTLGGEFIPQLDEGDFALETRMAPGTSLREMTKNTSRLESILLERFPEVVAVITKIGAGEIPTDPMPIEGADIMVSLKDQSEWTSASSSEELAEMMAAELAALPGVDVEFSQPVEMRFNELMTGIKQDIAVKIYGEDLTILQQQADKAARIIRETEGAADVLVEQVTGLPQIIISYDRRRIAEYGLSVAQLNQAVRTAFSGGIAGQVFEGERRFDLVVRLDSAARTDISAVRNLYVPVPGGHTVPLHEVAVVELKEEPAQISRDNTRRRIVIGVNVRRRDTQGFVDEMEDQLKRKLLLPPGYFITFGGEFENLQRAQQRLAIVVPLVLVLIFIMLFLSLGSLPQTFLIYTAIPFAAVGGVIALWLRGMPFSISAGVGFIALFGVAVLNGLVLISSLNELKQKGITDLNERIHQAAQSRLRPILLTAVTDILGFLPMAISTSSGAEVQRPLATVVIGGILTASVLTLVILPVLYGWMEKRSVFQAKPLMIFLILGAGLLWPAWSRAQDVTAIDLVTAEQMALDRNGSIRAAKQRVQAAQSLRRTAFAPGKALLETQYGQYNSFYNDLGFGISQSFAFPSVYGARAGLQDAELETSRMEMVVSENELIARVRVVWYELQWLMHREELLQMQDSLYQQFYRSAQLRYQVGEVNRLEMITAETRLMEMHTLQQANLADQQALLAKLVAWTGLPEGFEPVRMTSLKRPLDSGWLMTDSLTDNPDLQELQQRWKVAEKQQQLSKAEMMPDITIGYQNQSFQGYYERDGGQEFVGRNQRFESFSLGIAVPLWYRSGTAKITALKLEKEAAMSEYEQEQKNLMGDWQALTQSYRNDLRTIAYYETSMLPQAQLVIESVQTGYASGEIDYVAFLQGISQAVAIREDYLAALNHYNQTVIAMERLTGQYSPSLMK